MSARIRCEVAVAGAGPVGLLMALALARTGRSVCLVGPEPERRDGRTAALLASSVSLLEELGLWAALAPDAGALRVLRIVDDTGSLFRPPPVEFRADEIGLDAFGFNVENARLADALAQAVRREPGIIWTPAFVEGFDGGDPAVLALADGTQVEADLAVAADGRRSRLREASGITAQERAFRQTAVTAILTHARPHRDVSTEFHTRSGPLTLVPLPGQRSSLVWVTSPHHAERLGRLEADGLARAVERAVHGILGDMSLSGPRGAVPLGSMAADRYHARRLALAGEAAHVLPPIGAQGLNLGFGDVAALRELTAGAADVADPGLLAAYDRRRRQDAEWRGLAVLGLNRSLLTNLAPVDALRGVALGLLGRVGPLRRAVMRAGLPRPTPSRP